MSKYHVLYNPKSNNGAAEEETKKLSSLLEGNEIVYTDLFTVSDMRDFIRGLDADDKLVIAGGDGTLNYFINDLDGDIPQNEVFFYATGTGNDFLNSIGKQRGELVPINRYLTKLPTVTVNGKDYKFINGVGFGIDGYCCEVGDKQREKSDKPVNYTSIAIKGLLFHFKPVNAKVTVDGKTKRYQKVWIAPTMFGGFYGGGMNATPDQKREDGTVSTMVYHNCGKIKALMAFPSIFEGKHVEKTDIVEVIKGHEVTVEFDRPTALQIDGETIKNVLSYSVKI